MRFPILRIVAMVLPVPSSRTTGSQPRLPQGRISAPKPLWPPGNRAAPNRRPCPRQRWKIGQFARRNGRKEKDRKSCWTRLSDVIRRTLASRQSHRPVHGYAHLRLHSVLSWIESSLENKSTEISSRQGECRNSKPNTLAAAVIDYSF